MFAVIKTGGKQYIVHPGEKIKIEKLETPEENEVVFDDVLLISDKETMLGTPYVKGHAVKARVLRHGKGKKVIVYKYKPKKRYHKKQGHRQLFTEVEILAIGAETSGGNRAAASSGAVSAVPVKKISTAAKKAAEKTPAKTE